MQLSRTGKKWISVIVTIRPVFPDPVTYSVTRKEMLAVVSFLHHFWPYLLGRQFKLRTDHGSFLWLRGFKEPEGQLARWLEQLEEHDFDVVH